jgi:hypothetical protein
MSSGYRSWDFDAKNGSNMNESRVQASVVLRRIK